MKMAVEWNEIEKLYSQMAPQMEGLEHSLQGKIAVWGAGFAGLQALELIQSKAWNQICFIDNHPEKQGQKMAGFPIISSQQIQDFDLDIVMIATRHSVKAVQNQLVSLDIPSISLDAYFVWASFGAFRDFYHNYLQDKISRQHFSSVIYAMLTGDLSVLSTISAPEQYFILPQFRGGVAEHFVDAGAYVGDTLERFLWAHNGFFSRIYAFEPGQLQFKSMERRVERLKMEWAISDEKIVLQRAALGSENTHLHLQTLSGSLQSLQGTLTHHEKLEQTPVFSLDDWLSERIVTFIKVDIEGMEMAFLKGAARTISQYRPKLALSVYHHPNDLYMIAQYVRSLVPEYRFELRHHSRVLMETILYAYIDE